MANFHYTFCTVLFIVVTWMFSDKTGTVSIMSDEKEQNAYIPYTYARNCIARITGDMTDMKSNHLRIVRDIEKHYRAIEDETQVQIRVVCMDKCHHHYHHHYHVSLNHKRSLGHHR